MKTMLIPRMKITAGKYRGRDGTVIARKPGQSMKQTGHTRSITIWIDEATGKWIGYTLREAEELCARRFQATQERYRNQ